MQKKPTSLTRYIALAFASLILIVSISGAAFPQPVYASDPDSPIQVAKDIFSSVSNATTAITSKFTLLKGTTLDPIAWAVAKAVLQSVVNSTIKWINSGFNGSPAFATNLGKTLQAVSDTQANLFIQQLTSNSAIKSPFQSQVASAVSANYLQSTGSNGFFNQNPFTLGSVSSNPTAFLQGGSGFASGGGFNAWISAAMTSANNPYGATLLANQAITAPVASAQNQQTKEFAAGSGFLSFRGNCQTSTTGKSTASSTGTSLSPSSGCQSQNVVTPGGVIANGLYKSLGSGIDTLVSAHQFDEIVNALLGQLMNQVLGSGGLAGVSKPSAATGGVAYFDQTSPAVTGTGIAAGTGGTAAGAVSADFTTAVTSQIIELQTFQTNWNTIATAAFTAENTLQNSSCTPNAQTIIASQVQPIINESTNEIAEASSSIATLNQIAAEAPIVNSDGTPSSAAQNTQASTDYSCFLSSGEVANADGTCAPVNSVPVPSQSDMDYAQEQSIDTGITTSGGTTGIPESLLTQMNQITQEAQSCSIPNTVNVPNFNGLGNNI